jgi:hypothetical protein
VEQFDISYRIDVYPGRAVSINVFVKTVFIGFYMYKMRAGRTMSAIFFAYRFGKT